MVKHHIQEHKNDKTSSNESDPLHSAATISLTTACNSTCMNDKTEDNASAFVNSKSTKLRY